MFPLETYHKAMEVFLVETRRRPPTSTLAQLRDSKGLTQKAVADAVGVQRVTYTQIELGTKRPSLDVALKLAQFFEVPVEQLFAEAKHMERDAKGD